MYEFYTKQREKKKPRIRINKFKQFPACQQQNLFAHAAKCKITSCEAGQEFVEYVS